VYPEVLGCPSFLPGEKAIPAGGDWSNSE